MRQDERGVSMFNISAVPVSGIGGLGLVAMAVVVAAFFPAIGRMMAFGLAGGVVLGAILVIARRHFTSREPDGNHPAILFRDEHVPGRCGSPPDRELLTANC